MNNCLSTFIVLLVLVFGFSGYKSCNSSPDKQLNDLASTCAQQLIKQRANSVAITDFVSIDGTLGNLGHRVTQQFKAKLSIYANNFKISDRSEVQRLLREQKVNESGLLLNESVSKLGNMYGVNSVIRGKFSAVDNWFSDDEVYVFVDVIDLETGSVMTFQTGKIVLAD